MDHPRIGEDIYYLDLRAIYHEKRSKIERAMIKAKIKKAKIAFLIIQPNLSTKMKTQITVTIHAIISPRCSCRYFFIRDYLSSFFREFLPLLFYFAQLYSIIINVLESWQSGNAADSKSAEPMLNWCAGSNPVLSLL